MKKDKVTSSDFDFPSQEEINNIVWEDFSGGIYAANFEGVPVEKWETRGTCAFSYKVVQMKLKKILGQVLTILEASVSNENQLKAMKDLIRNDFSIEMSDLFQMSRGDYEELIDRSFKEAEENGLVEEVSLKEAMGV